MRTIKFRALFKHIATRKTVWFESLPNHKIDGLDRYVQLTEWLQFTGLRDKNGKEIYEGDIVEYNKIMWNNDNRIKNEIAFERGIFRLKGSTSLSIVCSPDFESEVIGNIHENPELIKD